MSEFPLVVLVILTWNNERDTMQCLESVSKIDYDNYEVIVVDNGSTDSTVRTIRRRFPEVSVIENEDNFGFAEGNNVGIRMAISNQADYVMLLNNDTTVHPDVLTHLVSAIELDPRIGIIGPLIRYFDPPQRIWSAGNAIDWNSGIVISLRQGDEGDTHGDPYEVDYVSGCALLMKREVVEDVGLLDPRYYLYFEETDFCARVRTRGYKICVEPQALIWHKVSASIGAASPAITYYMSRNVFLFIRNNLFGFDRLQAQIRAIVREIRTLLAHTFKPKYRHMNHDRNARFLALRDVVLGHWGRWDRT